MPFTSSPRRALGLLAVGTVGLSTAFLGVPGIAQATGTVHQLTATTITVPAGMCSVQFRVTGGSGASTQSRHGGLGALVTVDVTATPGDQFVLRPGAAGAGTAGGASAAGTGGMGGVLAGGGGGASSVREDGADIVVAAGGGGAGTRADGGDGDTPGGDYGISLDTYSGGQPGSDSAAGAGGSTNGASGTDGSTGSGSGGAGAPGAGGGGGIFGGGGGASDGTEGAGGGGGGSLIPEGSDTVQVVDNGTALAARGAGSVDYTFEVCPPTPAPGTPNLHGLFGGENSATALLYPGGQDQADTSPLHYEYSVDGGPWTTLPTTLDDSTGGDLGVIRGLTNGHTYSVRVRDVSAAGASDPTDPQDVTPVHQIGAPTHVKATVGASSILLTWDAPADPAGIRGYQAWAIPGVNIQSNSGQIDCHPLSAAARSCLIGVPAGKRYTVGVAAFGADRGIGAFLETAAVPAVSIPSSAPVATAPLATDKGTVSSLPAGGKVTLAGSGYLPFSTVTLVIYSTPRVLGTVQADANGNFSYAVTVPAGFSSSHSLVAAGVGLNGRPRDLRMDITVVANAAELAYTGASIAGPAIGGLLALLVGAGLLVASRRRTGH